MHTRFNADLSVTPAEARAIAAAAKRAGVSKRVWITQLVRERIDQADDTARIEHLIDRLDTETRARAASTTEKTLSVIRTEAQRLTEAVVAAMQQAIPQAPAPVTKEKPAAWGELTTALQKLGMAVHTNKRADEKLRDAAIPIAAACSEEFSNFMRPVNLVRDQFLILEKVTRGHQVEDPKLQHLFDLIHQFIPTNPRSHP
jgi:hypothetical protein